MTASVRPLLRSILRQVVGGKSNLLSLFRRPDGASRYLRPDGALYVRP